MRVNAHFMARECYCAVLRTAARKVTALYDAALEPSGINLAQYSLLRTIQRRAPLSLTELGRLTELDRSTIGRNVRLLQRLELVRVEPGAEDQREAVVTLDRAGADALERAGPLWHEAQRQVESTLGADHARQLRTLLRAL
jgi:DNA-binding MarR family transcriptional regulator